MKTTKTIMVQETTDYDHFKLMKGNRNLDLGHVEKIRASMLENPDWFKTKPAVVNEHGFVIDGQHRLEAAKQTGLPFYFIQADKMELGAAREMNIRQKAWTLRDYAQSYADSGHKAYQVVLSLAAKYPHLALSVVATIAGGSGYGHSAAFRSGQLELRDMELVNEQAELVAEIAHISNIHVGVSYTRALLQVAENEVWDNTRFLRKLEEKPDALQQSSLIRDNLRNIELIFNRNVTATGYIRLF